MKRWTYNREPSTPKHGVRGLMRHPLQTSFWVGSKEGICMFVKWVPT